MTDRGMPTPLGFPAVLYAGAYSVEVAESADGRRVGVGSIYDVDERDQTCFAEVHVAPLPDIDRQAIERCAWDFVLKRCFDRSGFRLAYVASVEFAPPGMPLSAQTIERARVRNHVLHGGHQWDLVVDEVVSWSP